MYSRYDFKSGLRLLEPHARGGSLQRPDRRDVRRRHPRHRHSGRRHHGRPESLRHSLLPDLPQRVPSTFSSLWANDEEKIRPIAYKTVNAANVVQRPTRRRIEWRTYVRGTDFFTGLQLPAGARRTAPPVSSRTATTAGCRSRARRRRTFSSPGPAASTGCSSGMALFRVNYDLDYAKANQIYKLGSGEAFTSRPGTTRSRCPTSSPATATWPSRRTARLPTAPAPSA